LRIYLIYDIYLEKVEVDIGIEPVSISVDELTQAREIVYRLLDELKVDAYLFEVEPNNEQWEVVIECAIAEGWERIRLSTSRENLLASRDDAATYQSLLNAWRDRLSACKQKE
jgi:hypothetical protein